MNIAQLTFESPAVEMLFYLVVGFVALLLLFLGYKIGTWIGTARSQRLVESKEKDLFTAQQGFKQLYETELKTLKGENEKLRAEAEALEVRVEEYRKKAAGFGGLFS